MERAARNEDLRDGRGSCAEPLPNHCGRITTRVSGQRFRLARAGPQELPNSRKCKRRRDCAPENEQTIPNPVSPLWTHPMGCVVEVIEHRPKVLAKLLVGRQLRVDPARLDVLREPLSCRG